MCSLTNEEIKTLQDFHICVDQIIIWMNVLPKTLSRFQKISTIWKFIARFFKVLKDSTMCDAAHGLINLDAQVYNFGEFTSYDEELKFMQEFIDNVEQKVHDKKLCEKWFDLYRILNKIYFEIEIEPTGSKENKQIRPEID